MPRLGERRTLKNGRVIEYRYPTLSDGTTGSKLVPVFVKTGEESLGGSKSRKLSMSSARKLLNKEYAQEERPSSRRRKSRVLTPSAKARLLSKLRKRSKSARKSTRKMTGGSRKRSENTMSGVRPVSLQEAVSLLRKYYSQK